MGEAIAWIGVIAATAVVACAPAPPPAIELDLAPGITACEGQARHIDAFVDEVFDRLDRPVPGDLHVVVHVLEHGDIDAVEQCPATAGGCALEGEAWTEGHGPLLHELTHVLMRELAPRGLPALSEGIAESMGTMSPLWPEPTPRIPLAAYALRSAAQLEADERLSAAFYATFLLDRHGPNAYLDAYAQLAAGDDLGAVDTTFTQSFGEPLEANDVLFADPAQARCMMALAHCGETLGVPYETPFEVEASLECSEPGVLGFSSGDGQMRPFRRFQAVIAQSGPHRVEVEGAVIFGMRCGSCAERLGPIAFNGSAPPTEPIELDAGLYVFEVSQLIDEHASFRLKIEAVSP